MNNKEKNFISAVIYVRNDEKNIASFLDKINAVFQKNFLKYELIFVNDGSLDKTVDIIKREAGKQKNGSISILNMSINMKININ